jgi:hypothetical protein
MSLQELEDAVAKLPHDDLKVFAEWFEEYLATEWDRQIEADAAARNSMLRRSQPTANSRPVDALPFKNFRYGGVLESPRAAGSAFPRINRQQLRANVFGGAKRRTWRGVTLLLKATAIKHSILQLIRTARPDPSSRRFRAPACD